MLLSLVVISVVLATVAQVLVVAVLGSVVLHGAGAPAVARAYAKSQPEPVT